MRLSKDFEALRAGDLVDVVAPGSGLPVDVLKKTPAFFNSWNLRCRIPKNLLRPTALHSNTDEVRFETLKAALFSEESRAVWCLRGGYGSNRLIPHLIKLKKPKRKKIFVGISDVTSLHIFLQQEWGWVTYHGSLLDRLVQGTLPKKCEQETKQILFGDKKEVSFRLKPMNEWADLKRVLRGPIVGGNLVTIQSTLGTVSEIETRGKFLFIEEIAERGYRVDRILEHLRQCDKFSGCRGLLIGQFVGGAENDGRYVWKTVLRDWAKSLKIPVYSGLESGHGQKLRTLPLGTAARIVGSELIVTTGLLPTTGFI